MSARTVLKDGDEGGGASFCGCCGRPTAYSEFWCRDCDGHLRRGPWPLWDQTYFAQYGVACPFEEDAAQNRFDSLRRPRGRKP